MLALKCGALLLLLSWATCASERKQPHIIFIVADDLGWADVSFHGFPQIPTPNIDALAASGLILNQYYVSPMCSPSRGAFLSGMHPIHTGLQHFVLSATGPNALPLKHKLLPEYLKGLGYATHAIGKWHLGFYKKEFTPTYRGFDTHFGYWTAKEDYFTRIAYEPYEYEGKVINATGLDFHDGINPVTNETGRYATDLFTDKAIDLLKNHDKNKPLFLYLAHLACHVGNDELQAPPEYVIRFPHIQDENRRTYAGMVSSLDEGIGNVFKALHDYGYLDNVIVVVTTDNGGAAGQVDNNRGYNWPFRGTKTTIWDGSMRGTALVWSPLLPRGVVANQMMHATDWLPTLYAAAGGSAKTLDLDGIDLWDSLRFNLDSPRTEILHNIDPVWNMSALRIGDYKLVQGAFSRDGKFFSDWYRPDGLEEEIPDNTDSLPAQVAEVLKELSISTESSSVPVKISCGPRPEDAMSNCKPLEAPCLYNIAQDPCEYHNIAHKEPEIVQILLRRLQEYEETSVPPLVEPAVRESDPALHNNQWVPYMDEEFRVTTPRE